jgi:hypothetical protein
MKKINFRTIFKVFSILLILGSIVYAFWSESISSYGFKKNVFFAPGGFVLGMVIACFAFSDGKKGK